MTERAFLPPQQTLDSASLHARINHTSERQKPISAIPSFAQEKRYQEAARSAIETSQQGVTIFQPYMYRVEGKVQDEEGKKQHHDIASRYASVRVGEKEAWFEIIGQQDRSKVKTVDFITADPLQIILGDKNIEDLQKLHDYTDEPTEDKTLVRFVGIHEIPLYTGIERANDPQEIQQAALVLTQQLVTKESPIPEVPPIEDIEEFVERQTQFEPLVTASNGVLLGKPQAMEVMLDNSHERLLYLYPALTIDGERTTIITNKELGTNQDIPKGTEKSVIGRTDFYCGCQKHGERAQGHGCGRELLGALKDVISPEDASPENDQTIIVAWGGVDDLGNGSVLHSLKTPNAEKLGILPAPDRQADTGKPTYLRRSREIFRGMPHIENRNFESMASVMFAGAELSGATTVKFYTGNEVKKQAVANARDMMYRQSGRYMEIDATEHGLRVVPEEVRIRDQADRNPSRRYAAMQA